MGYTYSMNLMIVEILEHGLELEDCVYTHLHLHGLLKLYPKVKYSQHWSSLYVGKHTQYTVREKSNLSTL